MSIVLLLVAWSHDFGHFLLGLSVALQVVMFLFSIATKRSTILRTRTASDCSASEPCLLASTVSVSDRSEKPDPNVDYFCNHLFQLSNSRPHYFKLLPIFLIQGLNTLGARGKGVAAGLA